MCPDCAKEKYGATKGEIEKRGLLEKNRMIDRYGGESGLKLTGRVVIDGGDGKG